MNLLNVACLLYVRCDFIEVIFTPSHLSQGKEFLKKTLNYHPPFPFPPKEERNINPFQVHVQQSH